jgi:hypothetical protein
MRDQETDINQIMWFENMTAYCDHLESTVLNHSGVGGRRLRGSYTAFSGDTFETCKEKAYNGQSENVDAIEKLVGKIESAIPISSATPRWSDAVCGHIPLVPHDIIGLPNAMLAPNYEMATDSAPVRIVTDVCVSAGVSKKEIANRGAAIAALAYTLSAARPVELIASAGMGSGPGDANIDRTAIINCVRLGASPLNIRQVAFALTNQAFLRRLALASSYHYQETVAGVDYPAGIVWPWNDEPRNNDARMREALGLEPSDLYIGGFYLDEININPEQWVRDRIAEHAPEMLAA